MSDFATPWTVALQVSLSFTISWSLLKLMSIESVISSNHIFCPNYSKYQNFPSSLQPVFRSNEIQSPKQSWWAVCCWAAPPSSQPARPGAAHPPEGLWLLRAATSQHSHISDSQPSVQSLSVFQHSVAEHWTAETTQCQSLRLFFWNHFWVKLLPAAIALSAPLRVWTMWRLLHWVAVCPDGV